MTTYIAIPKRDTEMRFYFPEFPTSKLDGMMAWGAGKFEGKHNGLKCRKDIYGMDQKGNEFHVTPDMFPQSAGMVLVKMWHAGVGTEIFYLIK